MTTMFTNFRSACPIDALPDLLYNAACEIGQITEAPAEVLLTDAIAVACLAVSLRHDVRSFDGRTMPTSIFTAALARSGIGKGQSLIQFFKCFKEDTKEKLKRELTTGQPAEADDDLILEEITLPALMDRLHGIGKGCSIQIEEGQRFIRMMIKLDEVLSQLWSGDPPVKRRVKGVSRTALDARLGLSFRIQPYLFYKYLIKDDGRTYEQGLWARFLLACYDTDRFPTPQPSMRLRGAGTGHNDHLQAVLKKLVEQAQRCPAGGPRVVIDLSKEASMYMRMLKDRIKHWCPPHYKTIMPSVDRAWENTLRLAAVFHVVCEEGGQISEEMVDRAWAIVEWSLSQHYMVFVEAVSSIPKQKAASVDSARAPRKATRADDARRVMESVWNARRLRSSDESFFDEVERVADLPPLRFLRAVDWLVRRKQVEVHGEGQLRRVRSLISRPTYLAYGRL
ncbi:DUF3987 domain-containing protein [Xanthomonas translucens]|uniref:DUF3987 domain-containing protein n=1 Tax=Xanthomonas campestris pv. translucens TaxID=343 RepID=UPI001F427B61|nr:DUF3987 domain-containing protein [Xanthomonas translucens]UJB15461.1 DUF3987 domain-containing protein [Xanthomonas translucens pv. undulosa]